MYMPQVVLSQCQRTRIKIKRVPDNGPRVGDRHHEDLAAAPAGHSSGRHRLSRWDAC